MCSLSGRVVENVRVYFADITYIHKIFCKFDVIVVLPIMLIFLNDFCSV